MTSVLPLLNLVLEGALITAAVMVATYFARPRLRVLLTRCAFILTLIATAALFLPLPRMSVFNLPEHKSEVLVSLTTFTRAEHALAPAGAPHVIEVSTLTLVLAAIWLAGAALLLVRQLASMLWLSRAFAEGLSPSDDAERQLALLRARFAIKRNVALRLSDRIASPCTFGVIAPKVLAPLSMRGQPLEVMLAHELCHIRNHDVLWLMISRLACAIHWFNPGFWAIAQNHRRDIELICDDDAAGGARADYAASLVRIAQWLAPRQQAAAGVMMSRDGLAARVRSLLDHETPMPRAALGSKAVAYVSTLCAVAALASVNLVAVRAEEINLGRTPKPGNGFVYVEVPRHVRVDIPAAGLGCWDNASCVTETTLGRDIELLATSDRPGHFKWSGCEASSDGTTCRLRVDPTPAHVTVQLER